MCALSNHIRERPGWWEEVKDKVIAEKWREEILREQEESGEATNTSRLTPAMVKYRVIFKPIPHPYFCI